MKKLLLFSTILFCGSFLGAQTNFIKQDSVFAQSSDCVGGVNICVDSFTYGNLADYQFLLDGQPFNVAFQPCREDTFQLYFLNSIFQGGETGPFKLNSWTVDGNTFSIPSFNNLNQLLDSMRRWNPSGNWQLDTTAQLIFGFPLIGRTYSCQSITGLSRNGTTEICYNNGIASTGLKFRVNPGFHQLIVHDTVKNVRDTVTLGAACIQKDTIRQTMNVNTNRAYCVSSTQLLGQPILATFTNFCAHPTTHVIFDSLFNYCASYKAVTAGTDTACLRVCDKYGICDTTYLYITSEVSPYRNYLFTDTITVGLNRQKCNISSPNGTFKSIRNMCLTRSGSEITFAVDSVARCVTYTGVKVGTDTACIEVCNTLGLCDTTIFYIQGTAILRGGSFMVIDTIFKDSIGTKCNLNLPTGTINIFNNFCPSSSGTNIQFSLDNGLHCVSYRGLTVGTDTACVVACNAAGTCDTTTYIVTAKPNAIPPRGGRYVFKDTISVSNSRQKCDLTIPTGTINVFQNYCLGSSGSNVNFILDAQTRCVTYQGLTIGFDTACIRVCNTVGTCDTTTFIIETKAASTSTGFRTHIFNDTITVGLSRSKCDFVTPFGATIFENICAGNSGTYVQFNVNSTTRCATYTGVIAGVDTACIRVCNASGLCDTTYVYIRAKLPANTLPKPSVDTIHLKIFERQTYCPDSSELFGSPLSLIKFCTPANFNNVDIRLDTVKKCVVVTGRSTGVDTFCIAICNAAGLCDTTTLYVKVGVDTLKPKPSIDAITIKVGELISYCPDTTELLSGRIINIRSCTNTNYDNSSMILNNTTKCADIRGISVGVDTACLVLCNSAGLCDTTTLFVTVRANILSPTPSTEIVNIKLGKDSLFKNIDTLQIAGVVDTIYDACPGKNGSHARMVLSRSNRTIQISGLTIGRDTMCIVVCNRRSGLCDTTTIIANVTDTTNLTNLIAVNDFDTLRQGRSVVLSVYKNDSLRGKIPTSLIITRPPLFGTADTISFRQGLIKYTASRSPYACGVDSFRYRLCVDTVCAEAVVVIEVTCSDSLKAYNAISPNGDSRNDAFVLEGLQKYPNNTLIIFNRWGNEIFKVKNYENDWQGTWNGKDLPDGTYFYWIRDDDTGEVIRTGYLQILR